ncbi:putative 26S proteasome non-ATPase regulatory subunit 3 [Hibiscus syriacus]|uniref:26S proteasome non-ATPase regulatory subunit 3 n=1 Tax=Hibiscus syriacus TaxID=106335 RepID=A0A6A2ZH55_HIBSY|nr:putative 26S proteasome non-ATPase regulatory subunit 3 [Hibiscus syriacus]
MVVNYWLNDVKNMMNMIPCDDQGKLEGVVSLLMEQASVWWNTVNARVFPEQIMWEFFLRKFKEKLSRFAYEFLLMEKARIDRFISRLDSQYKRILAQTRRKFFPHLHPQAERNFMERSPSKLRQTGTRGLGFCLVPEYEHCGKRHIVQCWYAEGKCYHCKQAVHFIDSQTMTQDVEMKEQPAPSNSVTYSSPSTLHHLKEIASLIEIGAYDHECRRILKAIRLTMALRRKLKPSVLVGNALVSSQVSLFYLHVTLEIFFCKDEHEMEVDTATSSAQPLAKHSLPELEICCYLLVLIFLIDQKKYGEAKACSYASIARLKNLNRMTVDVLAARLYFYYSLCYELTDVKECLLQAARKSPVASLGFRVQCNIWAIIVLLLLGEILERTFFMQKGMEKAFRPYFELINDHIRRMETAEMRMLRWACGRTLWDMTPNSAIRMSLGVVHVSEKLREGRIRWCGHIRRRQPSDAVRRVELITIDGAKRRGRPRRKWEDCLRSDLKDLAPTEDMTSDRKVWRLKTRSSTEAALNLALGVAYYPTSPLPHYIWEYGFVVVAVRIGHLELFRYVAEKFSSTFNSDRTNNLIVRMQHNVIQTGLCNISISYSRISLADVAKKLRLDSVADAESIVAMKIRDGSIDATLDHSNGCMLSKETGYIYSTTVPQMAEKSIGK